jgi:hypothetical protein
MAKAQFDPSASLPSRKGRNWRTIGVSLTLIVLVAAATGTYFHFSRQKLRNVSGRGVAAAATNLEEPILTRTISRLRRHLAWGAADAEEDNVIEDIHDTLDEAPGVPEDDDTPKKKKKKKFSFDDNLDDDLGDEADMSDDDMGDDDVPGDDADVGPKRPKKKGKATTKKGSKKKPVGKKGRGRTDDSPVIINARPGGGASRVSRGGGRSSPEDGKKDPLTPTLDTRDTRRYADEVVLPDGHTVHIDVPSP